MQAGQGVSDGQGAADAEGQDCVAVCLATTKRCAMGFGRCHMLSGGNMAAVCACLAATGACNPGAVRAQTKRLLLFSPCTFGFEKTCFSSCFLTSTSTVSRMAFVNVGHMILIILLIMLTCRQAYRPGCTSGSAACRATTMRLRMPLCCCCCYFCCAVFLVVLLAGVPSSSHVYAPADSLGWWSMAPCNPAAYACRCQSWCQALAPPHRPCHLQTRPGMIGPWASGCGERFVGRPASST